MTPVGGQENGVVAVAESRAAAAERGTLLRGVSALPATPALFGS